jgi:hypothetical protein
MSVDGDWDTIVNSPMGAQKSVLTLKTDGNTLTGTDKGASGSTELKDGKIDGDKLTWALDVTSPMKIRIDVDVTVNGDQFEGSAKAGMFGKFPIIGTRRT